MRKTSFYLLLAFAVLLGTGCSASLPYNQRFASLPPGPLCRVAVLPFLGESEHPFGTAIAHKAFLAELIDPGFFVVQEGDVSKTYQQLRILPGQVPTSEELGIIADRLDAQLLITGKILEMRENPAEHASINPVLAMEIQIRDGRTTGLLWSTYHRRQGAEYQKAMHFGKIHTVTGLTHQVAREIINLWLKQGLMRCDVSPRF